jgi:hypothetical protein
MSAESISPDIATVFYSNLDGHMGVCSFGLYARSCGWRSSRAVLELHLGHDRIRLYRRQSCGAKLNGTHMVSSLWRLAHSTWLTQESCSGGQYHWVSEFAPPSCQKFLSYITGWISTLSWQAGYATRRTERLCQRKS